MCLFKKRADIKNTICFEFGYVVGWYANGDVSYKLEKKDDAYIAYVKPLGVPNEERQIYTVDEAFVTGLERLITEQRVSKWDGFKRADKRVADGRSFNLYYRNAAGQRIRASGYQKWPKNYVAVKGAVEAYFALLTREKQN